MDDLITERIPHAPQMGLYVAPNIPSDKRRNAVSDYAAEVPPERVLALYDATLTGNAKDGALFTADRLVFQNTNLEAPQTVRYRDLVGVKTKRRLLGGKKVLLKVNRGRATFDLTIDFSGAAEAADYVADFLEEAMHQSAAREMTSAGEDAETEANEKATTGADPDPPGTSATDALAVRRALDALRAEGKLTDADYRRLLAVLENDA